MDCSYKFMTILFSSALHDYITGMKTVKELVLWIQMKKFWLQLSWLKQNNDQGWWSQSGGSGCEWTNTFLFLFEKAKHRFGTVGMKAVNYTWSSKWAYKPLYFWSGSFVKIKHILNLSKCIVDGLNAWALWCLGPLPLANCKKLDLYKILLLYCKKLRVI